MAIVTVTTQRELRSSFIRIDPEFFRPQHVRAAKLLDSVPRRELIGQLTERVTQGPNPAFSPEGMPCVNGKNVYFGTIQEGNPNYVSPLEFKRLAGYCLQKNDLLITLKHATKIGRVWIVEDDTPRIFSRNVGLIRVKHDSPIRPSVLLLYLWTCFGQLLLDRCATGGTTGQITLPISELKRLPVPPFDDQNQTDIEVTFWKSRKFAEESAIAYAKAERSFASELGLNTLSLQRPVGYAARFSTVGLGRASSARRIDAQCFAPTALFYEDWLRTRGGDDQLSHICDSPVKGRQHDDALAGTTDYCSIKHISDHEIVGVSKCLPAAGAEFATSDDLLLAITGATIGKIGIVKRYTRLVFSGDLLRLRVKKGVDPHYMLLALDHQIGQVQFARWVTGSTNGHLSPRDVGKVSVPRLKPSTERQIGELVEESLAKRIESERLLEQAKTRVEQLVEKAVES